MLNVVSSAVLACEGQDGACARRTELVSARARGGLSIETPVIASPLHMFKEADIWSQKLIADTVVCVPY